MEWRIIHSTADQTTWAVVKRNGDLVAERTGFVSGAATIEQVQEQIGELALSELEQAMNEELGI